MKKIVSLFICMILLCGTAAAQTVSLPNSGYVLELPDGMKYSMLIRNTSATAAQHQLIPRSRRIFSAVKTSLARRFRRSILSRTRQIQANTLAL